MNTRPFLFFLPAIVLAVALLGVIAITPPARADHAVVVGINLYPGLSDGSLRGCVNDAQAMARTLESYGFQTRVLLDGQATKSGVVGAIAALQSVKPSDRVVFYFAGHGTQTPSGGARLMLSNALQDSTANDLSRDDLYTAFKAVPAHARTIVLDSCFSGGMMRSLRRRGKGTRFYDRASRGGNTKNLFREKTNMEPIDPNAPAAPICYYAASGTNEQAAEDDFSGERHGVFTQFLVTGLAKPPRPDHGVGTR